MRIAKKALGILLVLSMLVNVVALTAFAIPADTVAELTITADKETYVAGDEITLTVYCQTAEDCPSVEMAGQFEIGYDSAAIVPYSDSADLTMHGFEPQADHAATFDNSGSQVCFHDELLNMGTQVTEGAPFDKIIGYYIAEAGESFVPSVSAPVELFKFKMKVSESAPDGDYVIGFNKHGYDNYLAYVTPGNGSSIAGPSGIDMGFAETTMLSFGSVTIHVGAPVVEGPKVAKNAAQVKFTYDSTNEQYGVADTFNLRIKSVITDADWDKYFGSTTDAAATTNKITAVGMVAFPASGEFDQAAAMTAIENIGDKEYAGAYKAASTDYIQKADDASDAYFGAIINIKHSTCTSNLKYIGYVQYVDADNNAQTIFYDAAIEAKVSNTAEGTYYDNLVNSYKSQFPAK